MKTSLLTIPLKTTDEVDWVKPLNNYLLSIYGNTSEYQGDLNSFNKLRQDLRGVQADTTGIKLYYKYYSQIELLDLRIPFSVVNKHKRIHFVWYDAFDSSIEHKQNALPFEKANILFNLASLLSKQAAFKYEESQKSNNANDLVEAVKLLQQAAGIYQFLKENFLHAPSDDLSQNTLQFLISLMQAQSQEVFLLKVINGDLHQKQNSLIAKLCRSAAIHYDECFSKIKLDSVDRSAYDYGSDESFLEHPDTEEERTGSDQVTADIDPKWKLQIDFKAHYYKSLAYYFNGLHLEASHKYGEAIAYLTKSADILTSIGTDILKPAASEKCSLDYTLADNFKYQQDAVKIKLAELNKDNDLIYNEIIPSLVTLPDIKPMDSTKIIAINENTSFQEINDYNYNNFLNNVVPINIHELLSYYSEEKSQFLRNEIDLVDVSNEELASVLEFLKLPKALVTIKQLVNSDVEETKGSKLVISDGIKAICQEIEAKYPQDLANKQEITKVRKQIYDNISESESLMNPISHNQFKDELIKLKKTLYDATNSDNQLFGLVTDEYSELYILLAKGEYLKLFTLQSKEDTTKSITEEISLLDIDDRKIDELKNNSQVGINENLKILEDILHDLNVVKSNKTKLIDALKQEIHRDDISDILILNSKVKSTNEIKTIIFPQELKKFEPINLQLDNLISKQNELIENLKSQWESLSKNEHIKKIQNSKTFQDELVANQTEKINKFYATWKKYNLGLSKGVTFYQQLLNYSNGIKNNIQLTQKQSESYYSSQTPNFQQPQQPQPQHSGYQSQQLSGQPSSQTQYQNPQQVQNLQYQYQNLTGQQGFAQYGQVRSQPSGHNPGQQPVQRQPSYLSPIQPGPQFHQPGLIPVTTGGNTNSGAPPPLPSKEQPGAYHHINQQLNQPQPTQFQGNRQPGTHPGNYPTGNQTGNYPPGNYPPNTSSGNPQGSDLIYDQPSTYQPNMYNFFSNN